MPVKKDKLHEVPAACATLMNAVKTTPVRDNRKKRREYRHNIDALISLYEEKKKNNKEEALFLYQVKAAKSDEILDIKNGDYLIVNDEMKKAKDLREMIRTQVQSYDAIKTDKNSRLKTGYQNLLKNVDQLDKVSDFKKEMQTRAQAKKWVMTKDLPDTMKQELDGNTRVVAITRDTQSSITDRSKVYDNEPKGALSNNTEFINYLDRHPVQVQLNGASWYIKGKIDPEIGVVFVKVAHSNDLVNSYTEFVTSTEVESFSKQMGGKSFSAHIIERVVLAQDSKAKVMNEQTVKAINEKLKPHT